jgi:hypothetical protein
MVAEALLPSRLPDEAPALGDRVPTLTEVVDVDSPSAVTQIPPDKAARGGPEAAASSAAAELSAEVLFELEQGISSALEARLRESLAPAVACAVDGFVAAAQHQLARTLRELVDESVTRALERRTHL